MNAVAMFLQQMQLPVKQGESIKSLEDDESHALFQSLLDGSLMEGLLNNEQKDEENKENTVPLSLSLNLLVNQITDGEDLNKEMIGEISTTKVQEKVEQSDLPGEILNVPNTLENMQLIELPTAYQSLVNIFQEVQAILAQFYREPTNTEKVAPRLLDLLQQWVKAAGNPTGQKEIEKALTSFRHGDTKEHMIWKDLLQAFEKRNQLAAKQQYSANAHVTTEDVSRWLAKALEKQTPERLAVQRMYTPSSLPISQMEQYVVYVNQGKSLQAQGQQLTDQFQTIIKSSNFLTTSNNGNQLTLSLRPENLGEMMIRFTQINGEMSVKILVTTQAAKEMLETNMHQLRNMFSPQQVVVEKQETQMQQSQDTEKGLKDDQMEEEKHQQPHDSSEEEKQSSEDDFAAKFEALLMNEEV